MVRRCKRSCRSNLCLQKRAAGYARASVPLTQFSFGLTIIIAVEGAEKGRVKG